MTEPMAFELGIWEDLPSEAEIAEVIDEQELRVKILKVLAKAMACFPTCKQVLREVQVPSGTERVGNTARHPHEVHCWRWDSFGCQSICLKCLRVCKAR